MARNYSFVKLEGTVDDLTFYQKDGVNLVKKKSRVSRNRILNDPAYRRTRENMSEFGGAAKVGKAFREGFAGLSSLMGDTYMGARVNAVMKRINTFGAGPRGEREFNVVAYGEQLRGFEFNALKPFETQFYAPSTSPSINASRDTVQWDIPDFNTDTYIRVPEGATHCKLVLAAGYVSDYEYEPALKSYEPVDETVNGRGGVSYSAPIVLGGMVGSATALTVDLSGLGAIPVTTALFAATGIVFYQEINAVLYELAQGHAMKVVVTG
ncbi:hypothetical protein NA63_2584 [Flavobacteriaceae bacterium MAR_2010_105]|nr:hypothetical protein NA63_2584 [Flavobacteriaceae bacterium MAR_2010_105]